MANEQQSGGIVDVMLGWFFDLCGWVLNLVVKLAIALFCGIIKFFVYIFSLIFKKKEAQDDVQLDEPIADESVN